MDDLTRWEESYELSKWMTGVKYNTLRNYKFAIVKYQAFTGLGAKQLIDEAEEDLKKPRRERGKPEERLKAFHKWLLEEHPTKDAGHRLTGGKGLAPLSAANAIHTVRSFYRANGFPMSWTPPKAKPKKQNRRIELTIKDVNNMVSATSNNRDKALILAGFQAGFDALTVSLLDIGDLPRGFMEKLRGSDGDMDKAIADIKPPVLLEVVRQKESVDYSTCLGHDATRALCVYLQERLRQGEDLKPERPLFGVREYNGRERKDGDDRVTPNIIQKMMRHVVQKAGIISAEDLRYSDFNPAGYHALRKTFSRLLEDASMPVAYIEHMQGHQLPYNDAYRRPTSQKVLQAYGEYAHVLEVSKAPLTYSEIEEKLNRELDKERAYTRSLEGRVGELEKKIKLETAGAKLEALLKVLAGDPRFAEAIKNLG
ncbi:MAG: integrase [Dehalococcoidia bacterium]|nr:integrase [Dehalococcoidia bacterium]